MTQRLCETESPTQAFQAGIELIPRHELDQWQRSLLARTVRRAKCTAFYRTRLTAIRDDVDFLAPGCFQQLVPLTSKQDLRRAGTTTWSQGVEPMMVLATSGTTGTRVALPYTAADLQQWATLAARSLWANGLRPHDVVVLPVPLGLYTGGHGMFSGLRHLGCTVIPCGPVHTPQFLELLQGGVGVTPSAIVTLPTHMLRLLDALSALGYDPSSAPLRLGSFGAESWTEAARARIEAGFGLRAMDSYGIGELCGPGIAAECAYRDGMHVWEDAFFAEIIDPHSGEPVEDGVPGELVLTNLFREAIPLLRYRTGDAAAIVPGPCPCGRAHRRITRINGRLDDTLIITGVNIDPTDIETVLYQVAWLGNEFYLEAGGMLRDELVVHVECKAGMPVPAEGESSVAAAIRRIYPVRVTIQIHEAGQLERAPGKARRIRG